MGTLANEHGKALLTQDHQPSRTTLWPFAEVDRVSLFTVVLEAA